MSAKRPTLIKLKHFVDQQHIIENRLPLFLLTAICKCVYACTHNIPPSTHNECVYAQNAALPHVDHMLSVVSHYVTDLHFTSDYVSLTSALVGLNGANERLWWCSRALITLANHFHQHWDCFPSLS